LGSTSKKEFVFEKEVLPLELLIYSLMMFLISFVFIGLVFSSFDSAYIVEFVSTGFFSGNFFMLGLVVLYMAFQNKEKVEVKLREI